jgi:single-strand DNA-binding protein
MALNYSVLMGRLARDPELRRTNTGKAVATFTIAVDNFGKDNGASFFSCVAWDKTGEFVSNFFMKGSPIAVEGRLQTRQYENKEGKKQTVTELVVTQAHFCGKKEEKSDGFAAVEPTYPQNNFAVLDGDDGELPF